MTTPQISVIVPVYNVEQYLERCVDSILGQSFTNFEVILVNDCSPDGSSEICERYARQDKRVRVLHLDKNQGLSNARNAGLDVARGDLISFIDSDDWVPNNFLTILHQSLVETQSDISACAVTKIWSESIEQKRAPRSTLKPSTKVYSGEDALIDVLTSLKTIGPTAWNKLYKKTLFDEVSFPVGVLHEDALTTYKLINKCDKVCYSTETTYYYFQSPMSIMRGAFNSNRLSAIPYIDEVFNVANIANPAVSEAATFYKYAFYVGLVDDMLGQNEFQTQRRELMDWMLNKRGELMKNMYVTTGIKASLFLLNWPFVYEQLKKLRRDILGMVDRARLVIGMS